MYEKKNFFLKFTNYFEKNNLFKFTNYFAKLAITLCKLVK